MLLRLPCAFALVIALYFIASGHYLAGVPLLGLVAVMIMVTERIIHLTKGITRTPDGGHVHLHRDWAYWRHPAICGWIAATGIVILSPYVIDNSGALLTAIVVYFAGTFAILPRLHRKAWKESGCRWTEEHWSDSEGRPVRQLSIDGTSNDPENVPRIAIRADAHGIDLFVISLCNLKRWETDRFSTPRTGGVDLRVDTHDATITTADQSPRDNQTWRQGDRHAIAHAPDGQALAEEFAASGKLTITRSLPPFARPTVFDCTIAGERLRLKRFLDSVRTGHQVR